jgi:cell shape-determining protein MreC
MVASGGAVDAGVAGGQPIALAANIKGQVTAVQGDALSINVGSAKGVREGMVLVIHRKDKLVGYLRIDEVEVDEAVGIIEEKQSDPQQGDTVFQKDSI